MRTWFEDTQRLFNDEWRERGSFLRFNGAMIQCVKSALETQFIQQLSGFDYESITQIRVRRNDARVTGLYAKWEKQSADKRPVVTTFPKVENTGNALTETDLQLTALLMDDDQDATIVFAAKALK